MEAALARTSLWESFSNSRHLLLQAGAAAFVAFVLGFYRVTLPSDYPLLAAFAFWWLALQTAWVVFDVSSKLAYRALAKAFTPKLWVVLAVSGLVGTLLLQPVREVFGTVWMAYVLPVDIAGAMPAFDSAVRFFEHNFGYTVVPFVLWLVALSHLNSNESSRVPTETAPVPKVKPTGPIQEVVAWPEFIRPTMCKLGDTITSFQSEDHYIRFASMRATDLIRYRFKDAMKELKPLGFCQVHRGAAVRLEAIVECNVGTNGVHLRLKCGRELAVSRSFRIPLLDSLNATLPNLVKR
jgi:hypothetical protein